MVEALHFPAADAIKLESYLPLPRSYQATHAQPPLPERQRPFVTLTYATSLDASLALAPGVRTALSGPQSKAMTHYLRSRHDAILVGVGTAVADDPGLNCRLAGDSDNGVSRHQPRPVVVDPHDRWALTHDSRVLDTARRGLGLAPFIVTSVREPDPAKRNLLETHGGKYILLNTNPAPSDADGSGGNSDGTACFRWSDILIELSREGLNSVMIEGGAGVINTLLEPAGRPLVDSVIITIAPTWLGRGGVVVSPDRTPDSVRHGLPVARLTDVAWQQLGEDVILCGRFNR